MKKELSSNALIAIIGATVVVLGGVGYMWLNNASGGTPTSKADEQKAYEQAKAYYSDIGQKGPNAGRPGGNAEFDARMKSGAGQ